MQGKVSSSPEYIKATDEFTPVIHNVTSTDPSLCKEFSGHTDGLLILFSHFLIKPSAGLW